MLKAKRTIAICLACVSLLSSNALINANAEEVDDADYEIAAYEDSDEEILDIGTAIMKIGYWTFESWENNTWKIVGYDGPTGIDANISITMPYDGKELSELKTMLVNGEIGAVGKNVFNNVRARNITIPNSVRVIEENAFENVVAGSILIPDNIKTIKSQAFYNAVISNFEFVGNDDLTIEPEAFRYAVVNDIDLDAKSIGAYAFADNEALENVNVNTPFIDNSAFSNCPELKKITAVYTTKIGSGVFENDTNLQKVTLGEIESVPEDTFKNCPNSIEVEYIKAEDIKPIEHISTEVRAGDVDYDDAITSSDALSVLRNSVGLDEFTDEQKEIGDMDKDSKITSSDALVILRKSVGLE